MPDCRAVSRAALLVISTLAGVFTVASTFAVEGTSAPCLGLGSTQMMDAPGSVVAFDIGGDYAATLDNTGLTVWTFRSDGFPLRRGSWVARRGFPGYETYLPYLEVDPRGWAYIGGWETGFFIIDLRDPDRPEIVYESVPDEDRHLENAFNPILVGNALFLETAAQDKYVFLDVENPLNPRPFATGLPRASSPYVGFLNQHLVKAPAFQSTVGPIEIWDIADLNDPQRIATVPETHGLNPGVMWAGETAAFLAHRVEGQMWDEHTSLGVLDLADPVNPGYVEMHEFEEPPVDWFMVSSAVFEGSWSFVAAFIREGVSDRQVLDWVDMADPLTPSIEHRLPIPTNDPIKGLGVRDGRLYAVLQDGGMRVFETDDDFEEIWRVPSGGSTGAIDFHRGRAVIPHGHLGLKIYDVDSSDRLNLRGRLPLELPVVDLDISGDLAAVRGEDADLGAVVYLVDLTDPANPQLEAEIQYGQPLGDIALDGNLLITCEAFTYADETDHEWEIYDVSRATEPVLLAETHGSFCTSLDIRDTLVALKSSGLSTIFDLTDPTDPVQLSSVITGGDARSSVALTDKVMVIGTPWYIKGWDITDPANPIEVPEIRDLGAFPTWLRSYGNQIVGSSYQWRGSASLLAWLIDLDDPHQPVARSITLPRIAWTPALNDDRLFLPSPPFVEVWSTECAAPEARFELEQSWKEIWLNSTTPGVVDTLIWDFGDGTNEEQNLLMWSYHRTRDHSHAAHHRYSSPGRYTVELTAIGPQGTSRSSQVVVVETPPEFRATRQTGGRRSP